MEATGTVERWTIAAGVGISILAAVATFSGVQTWYAPLPTLVLIPAFVIGPIAPLLAGVSFCLWNYQLFMDKPAIPMRSFVLFVLFGALSGFSMGPDLFQSILDNEVDYLGAVAVINVGFLSALWLLYRHGKRNPSMYRSLGFHALLFIYLFTYCLPYTGELP